MIQSDTRIYTHYDKLPAVAVKAFESAVWIELGEASSPARIYLHCRCSRQEAEEAAVHLREAIRIAGRVSHTTAVALMAEKIAGIDMVPEPVVVPEQPEDFF